MNVEYLPFIILDERFNLKVNFVEKILVLEVWRLRLFFITRFYE